MKRRFFFHFSYLMNLVSSANVLLYKNRASRANLHCINLVKRMHLLLLISSLLLFSCNNDNDGRFASGVFEATEVIVSAENNGKILNLDVKEGDAIASNTKVGLIDSTQLHLQKLQLLASKSTVLANKPDIQVQIKATERELVKQKREHVRLKNLVAGEVATQKQLDDIEASVEILAARLESQKSNLNNSVNAIDAQIQTIDVQITQLEDQIENCIVTSPIDGTVLVKYAEKGEMAAMGKPLFKIADIDNMILKAYVTSEQLAHLQLGQDVTVLAEFGAEETKEYSGRITWISSKSEFTPKTIQTQDERANLVYAVKISVKNDGYLKIGMYGGFKISV